MKINMYILTGLMASFSIVLGVIENFIPTPVPAIRLGLSNVPILIMLYVASTKYAFLTSVLKSLIVPIFSANIIFKFSLGFPATMTAFIFMTIFYKLFKNRLSIVTISVIGAVSHIVVQMAVVSLFYIKGLIYTNIAGILLLSAVISGTLMGIISYKVVTNRQILNMFKRAADTRV